MRDVSRVILALVANIDNGDAFDCKPVLALALAALEPVVVDIHSSLIELGEVV